VFKSNDGIIYKGILVDAARHGKGVLIFTNGDIYEGQFE